MPVSLENHYALHCLYWMLTTFLWVMLAWAHYSDPGVIKTNRTAYDEAVKMVYTVTDVDYLSLSVSCWYWHTL